MYLKALEIQGFKSFPDKTILTFEKDITAIVGPNGSGKSNISDAILWVMGEQRSKALRGGKMEDVIFGGTEKRPKMGFAQVSLIIDNTARIFDTDASELMITRRYYRSGESEYYINRESVRLRDISEMLMDTGLGRYGYSIIGQGRIADVVSARSGDRRELFEEAAGISKFRYRKDESERKLQHTDENLLRINDKIDELELQVGPLKQQSETAKKYLVLRDELRLLEVSVWMDALDRLSGKAEAMESDYLRARTDHEAAQKELDGLYAQVESFSEKMREKDVLSEEERAKLSQAENRCAETESRIAVAENTAKHNIERKERLLAEIEEQGARSMALAAQIETKKSRVAEIAELLEALDIMAARTAEQAAAASGQAEDVRARAAEILSQKSSLETESARCATVLSMLADTAENRAAEEKRRSQLLKETEKHGGELELQLAEEKKRLAEAEGRCGELSNVLSGYRMRLQGQETRVQTAADEQTRLTIELRNTESRISLLSDMEKEYEGYGKAVKTVMRDSERGLLKGIWGPVANLVRADDRCALAIETALGGSMQSIVVDTQEQGKAAIERLKRTDGGRATFLPVNTIRGSELKRSPENEKGYLGTAFELAQFDDRLSSVFSYLLGRTVVAETLADAIAMSKRFDNQLRIVTLDGQLINAGGSMTGGSAARNTGILSRANELESLRKKRESLASDREGCAGRLAEAQRALTSTKYEIETSEYELKQAEEIRRRYENGAAQTSLLLGENEKKTMGLINDGKNAELLRLESEKRAESARRDGERLSGEIAGLDRELTALASTSEEFEKKRQELSTAVSKTAAERSALVSESEGAKQSVEELAALLADLSGDDESRRGAVEEIERQQRSEAESLSEQRLELEGLRAEAEAIKAGLTELTGQKLEIEGRRTRSEKAAQEKNRELLDMERLCGALEQKKLSAEMEEKQIIDKLWDSYELSRTAAQGVRQPVENAAFSGKRVSALRREIGALGTPNLGAIEEYDRIKTRYDFLTEQRDDVLKAKKELESIIGDITEQMKEIFLREFRVIDESFRKTFLELFGGGRAALVLEDEEDVLGCGIDIRVQPPGKALSTISLMSGGEMAFVAIALYFAIIKVRPTPFCVMDEIEAALDEANVERYAAYMRSMTDKTQFIVITHRRGTMEEADMLYGVTMQEKGVTQVISVDLSEAEKTLSK